jgi:hypothetical protein
MLFQIPVENRLSAEEASAGKFEPKLNGDGTLAVDVIRTGTWRHCWYGTLTIDDEALQRGIKNFDNGVIGNVVTFNYYHDRNKNFGTPVRLRTEPRMNKRNNRAFTMLVADTKLTDQGLEDVKRGEVLNFSAEIDHRYIHREVIPVDLIGDDGKPVLDEKGVPKKTFIQQEHGFTMLGGAVTNYPFITEMNPNGLGGNRTLFGDEQGYSNPIIAQPNELVNCLGKDDPASMQLRSIMCFSTIEEQLDNSIINEIEKKRLLEAEEFKKNSIALSVDDVELLSEILDNPILVGDCFYEREDFKAGDAALPDAAYAIVYETKTKTGKTSKVRKFPHHTSSVKSPTENTSLDMPRLKNAVARINQVGKTKTTAPAAKVSAAKTHLNAHADATYRKTTKKADNVEDHEEMSGAGEGTLQLDLNDPKVKAYVDSAVAAAVTPVKSEYEAKFKDLETANKNLSTKLELQQQNLVAAELQAFEAGVVKFADSILGGKATPACKEVIRCGMRGNKGLVMQYSNKKADGTFEYQNITMQDFVAKLLTTIEPGIDLTNRETSTSTTGSEVTVDQDGPVDKFADTVLNDEEAFVSLMEASRCGAGSKGLVSKTALRRAQSAAAGK